MTYIDLHFLLFYFIFMNNRGEERDFLAIGRKMRLISKYLKFIQLKLNFLHFLYCIC